MRIRALVVIALLTLPAGLTAQILRIPRTGRGTAPQPAALPPEAAPVARALAYKRSRWSAEGYSLISAVQVPTAAGGVARYTTAGTGTRAAYRYTDYLSATLDLTASFLGSPAVTQTAEIGTRFSPLPWDRTLRPFVDVRGAYMRMYDTFAELSVPNQQFADVERYSRGVGGVGGAGLEYSLTRSLALTTEVSALRNRMTTYRMTGAAGIPTGTSYWLTSVRYTLGLRFNPVSALHLAQKPTS
jgi:hypothetical protein